MKLTFISDTHGKEPVLTGGDILFHCGDLTINGFKSEVIKQLNYLHEQLDKYKYVVIIPGNHDLWAERHLEDFKEACLSGGIIALVHEGVELDGLKIWGSPATLEYHDWAFNFKSKEIIKIWDKIPLNTDIIITHGPPYDILDKSKNLTLGCPDLLEKINEINPKIHSFGHIHESNGVIEIGKTKFINCAISVIDIIL